MLATADVAAQTTDPPAIVTVGEATVDAAPDYVEFRLHKRAQGATTQEAVEKAKNFEAEVRAALTEKALEAQSIERSSVSLPEGLTAVAAISVRLRFRALQLDEQESLRQTAARCDSIRELANKLAATPEGPYFGLNDKDAIEQTAITRAIEQAYPHADAAAAVLQARISEVLRVEVEEVRWENKRDWSANEPEMTAIRCIAKVKISYRYGG